MTNIHDAVKQAAERAEAEQHRKTIEGLLDVYKGMYDGAATYVNVIMAGGYAGAFAVWALVGDALSKQQRSWAGLWLLTSLIVFVMWEVLKMILLGFNAIRFERICATTPRELAETIEKYKASEKKLMTKVHYFWAVFVLPASIVTGLAGGGVLIHAFVTNLF